MKTSKEKLCESFLSAVWISVLRFRSSGLEGHLYTLGLLTQEEPFLTQSQDLN